MLEDETLSKAELALIDRIVGALGIRSFQKLLWSKVEQAFRFTFRNTQVNYGFTRATPDTLALKYLEDRTFILSDKTQDRLTGNMRWELLEGIRNTENISEIKKRLDKVFTGMQDYEIERIARTETLNAMAEGRFQANVQSGVAVYKQWRAAINNKRTAADSRRLHGQIQKIGDPFVDPKTGDECMHNPNRPNCRCTVLYLRKLPENIVRKGGQMYNGDEMVGKIEIDISSLQKGEKRVWVKATSKRKGHYRRVKGAKKVEEIKEVPTVDNIQLYKDAASKTNDWMSDNPERGQEFDIVRDYCVSAYDDINYYLREGELMGGVEEEGVLVQESIMGKDEIIKASDRISNFLHSAPNFSGVTYRGMTFRTESDIGFKHFNSFMNNISVGKEFKLKSFTSTSSDEEQASKFTIGKGALNVNVLLEIRSKSGVALNGASAFPSEHEVLFDRGCEFKVVSVAKEGNFIGIKVEEI